MAGIANAGRNSDSVFGTGRHDIAKYGRLLRSRKLVGVRGAGLPFDGLYYVKSVTITKADHTPAVSNSITTGRVKMPTRGSRGFRPIKSGSGGSTASANAGRPSVARFT